MAIKSLIGKLFGADAVPPRDAMKLDGTTDATLARSLSALPPDERGWITFAEARILFSTKGAQYAFGETDQDGRLPALRKNFHARQNNPPVRSNHLGSVPRLEPTNRRVINGVGKRNLAQRLTCCHTLQGFARLVLGQLPFGLPLAGSSISNAR